MFDRGKWECTEFIKLSRTSEDEKMKIVMKKIEFASNLDFIVSVFSTFQSTSNPLRIVEFHHLLSAFTHLWVATTFRCDDSPELALWQSIWVPVSCQRKRLSNWQKTPVNLTKHYQFDKNFSVLKQSWTNRKPFKNAAYSTNFYIFSISHPGEKSFQSIITGGKLRQVPEKTKCLNF